MFGTGFFCGWPKYMSLSLSPKAKASWELRKATKKSPWHNNHLPYIVKERTYLLGSTPCVHASRPRSLDFFSRWCPSGASNFRPDMAAQCAKLHKIVSLIRISIKDSRNCNYLRKYLGRTFCVYRPWSWNFLWCHFLGPEYWIVWKLTSSAKIWDLSVVTEAHTLASGGFKSDRGQNEKNLRRKF